MLQQNVITYLSEGDIKNILEQVVDLCNSKNIEYNKVTAKEEQEYLLTKKQAQQFLQVSHVTLDKLIENGDISCFKIGHTIRLKKSDLIKSLVPIRNRKFCRRIH